VNALRLAIVILNYRTPELVVQCLASLESEVDMTCDRVIVVDNQSGDGSAQLIRESIASRAWSSWAHLVESERNGGFSYGNNVGMERAHARYYLLLNSDTIVREGAIHAMLAAIEARPDVGLLGPRLEWPDGEGQVSAFRDITPLGQMLTAARTGPLSRLFPKRVTAIDLTDEPLEPDWVSFACVLLRREVLETVGRMDDGYFMYYEDADYCRRARTAGWKVLYWPAAHVVHLRGGTSPVKELARSRRRLPRYYYEARARYFRLHFGIGGFVAANLLWTCGHLIAFLRHVASGRAVPACERQALDIWTRSWGGRAGPVRP